MSDQDISKALARLVGNLTLLLEDIVNATELQDDHKLVVTDNRAIHRAEQILATLFVDQVAQ